MEKINTYELIYEARLLRADTRGENPEYDRALVELVRYATGLERYVAERLVLGGARGATVDEMLTELDVLSFHAADDGELKDYGDAKLLLQVV